MNTPTAIATPQEARNHHAFRQAIGTGTGLLVADRHFPLIRGAMIIPKGAVFDPDKQSGCSKLLGDLLLRGCQGYTRRQFAAALDNISSDLSIQIGYESLAIRFACLTRYLPVTLDMLQLALTTATMIKSEQVALQEEYLAAAQAELDDDDAIAELFWRRAYYGHHPLARKLTGEVTDLRSLGAAELQACRQGWSSQGSIVGFAGDVVPDQAWQQTDALLQALISQAPSQAVPSQLPSLPSWPKNSGRLHIWLVNKPERVQVQMRLGFAGLAGNHDDVNALWLATLAFGGIFTSPLTTAIRDERGWSYIAQADFRRRSQYVAPIVCRMAPAVADATDCLEVASSLLAEFGSGTMTMAALAHARSYALQRHPFEVASGFDVLGSAIACELLGEDANAWQHFPQWLEQVDLATIGPIVQRHLAGQDRLAVLVGPCEPLEKSLRQRFPDAIFKVVQYSDEHW